MLQEADIGRATLIDEVAIVTGASSGIGAATARELALRGATVVLAARRADELETQAQATRRAGGEALAIPTDVADPTQVTLLVDRTVATFGRVDVLVNNAGANWSRPFASSHPDDITGLLEVNLLGAMLLTRAVLAGMLERRHGAIISVGSLSGRVAMEPLYSATKYGLRGFSLALRRQLAGSGVSASLVSPGKVRTAMTRDIQARMPEPGLVATTIADLVTHPRREVVVPRRHYAIAWLEQALPSMADLAFRHRHWSPNHEQAVGQAYNITNDRPLTQKRLLHAIAHELGASPPRLHLPYRPLYAAGYAAERLATRTRAQRQPVLTRLGVKLFGTDNRHAIDKARRELGYRPRIALEDGVRLAAAWYPPPTELAA